ncbi:MAG: choice-of-anchor tandem repeat GloVer-containing protein [Rhizomicrobium sp.]
MKALSTSFRKKQQGWSFQVIHDFCRKSDCPDGYAPAAGLIADVNGNIYGVTLGGGTGIHGCGVAFELLAPNWKFKTLHSFCASDGDGDEPSAALSYFGKAAGAFYDGVSPLYGVTDEGGAQGGGNGVHAAAQRRQMERNASLRFLRGPAMS